MIGEERTNERKSFKKINVILNKFIFGQPQWIQCLDSSGWFGVIWKA